MSLSGDTSEEDYDERPRGPEPVPAPKKPALSPLRLSLTVGTISGIILVCGVGASLMRTKIGEPAHRMKGQNNLKQIALGAHNYHETWGQFPHNTYTSDGKPLLSWRVHILPFIEQGALYNQFILDEPWDGPNNIRLLNEMPSTYHQPGHRNRAVVRTYYQGFSSSGAVFERRPGQHTPRFLPLLGPYPDPRHGLHLHDFRDGTDNTLLIVEAGDAVEWTRPDDLDASADKPFPKMGGMGWRKFFQAAMADGSVRSLKLDTPEATLRALVTHSGGETLPSDWDQ